MPNGNFLLAGNITFKMNTIRRVLASLVGRPVVGGPKGIKCWGVPTVVKIILSLPFKTAFLLPRDSPTLYAYITTSTRMSHRWRACRTESNTKQQSTTSKIFTHSPRYQVKSKSLGNQIGQKNIVLTNLRYVKNLC